MGVIHVLLADDHPMVRRGIRRILHTSPGIEVVGEASNGAEALELVKELEPDVLVLDMEMPVMRGPQVAERLQDEGSDLPVLALSAHEDRQFILGMLANGVAGYLVKDEVPETIVRAVIGVAHGEGGWVSERVAARIGLWMHDEHPGDFPLQAADKEILRRCSQGESSQQIAGEIHKDQADIDQRLLEVLETVREHLTEQMHCE